MNRTILNVLVLLLTASVSFSTVAQEKKQPRIDLGYFQPQQEGTYLIVQVRTKEGKKFDPVPGVNVSISVNGEQKGQVTTDKKGQGKWIIPDPVRSALDSALQFTFSANMSSDANFEEAEKEVEIHQARITLDPVTSDDGKQIHVLVEKREKDGWKPASGVEMKIFIKRQFGRLPVGEESYTSDENGKVAMDFKVDNLPGDPSGKITVGAFVEDNEDFGNLVVTREVAWGVAPAVIHDEFNDRTLWATRDKTPIWLLIFPNLIIVVVWGLILYLVLQIVKIKKIGKETSN